MILVVYAHPYPEHSRACRVLVDAVRDLPGLEVRSLYDRYPDFDIDVGAEQTALAAADLVVWLHPVYWYSAPGLLKQWFDKVLALGWAYGNDAAALRGKDCLWVAASGGEAEAYGPGGEHEQAFANFIPPFAQTARYCKMRWLDPVLVHGSHSISDTELAAHATRLRDRIVAWRAQHGVGTGAPGAESADETAVRPPR